ncbi:hypothetical protein MYX76_16695 [Desulfobacterota bacterium AH_259_B03_O07]|nr:hypothetical protein [Desulfobacterota bacterium AH_259_B03_O07]
MKSAIGGTFLSRTEAVTVEIASICFANLAMTLLAAWAVCNPDCFLCIVATLRSPLHKTMISSRRH